jgi:triosephosphate isomerase
MNVIPCVGETLEQRQSGQMFSVLDAQMKALFDRQVSFGIWIVELTDEEPFLQS